MRKLYNVNRVILMLKPYSGFDLNGKQISSEDFELFS